MSVPTNYQSQLNNFVPLGKIGQGSFSTVYKVRRVDDGKIYALKKVKLGCLKEKQKQAAMNEISILASFETPYIISYREAFFNESTHQLCIVLEWANEGDLMADINERKKDHSFMPESQIWRAAVDILSGMQVLHANCILHRDIKSANIFKSEGIYKLGDLNIAKICGDLAYTQTGTPYYASPQVWKQLPYDSKSDIWSFGCVIYEMSQLQPPFKAKDMGVLYQNVIGGKYPSISTIYSNQFRRLISCCLELDPKKRYSAQQLLQSSWFQSKVQQYRIKIPKLQTISKAIKVRNLSQKAITQPKQKFSIANYQLPAPNYLKLKQTVNENKKRVLLLPSKKKVVSNKRIRPLSHQQIKRNKTDVSSQNLSVNKIKSVIIEEDKKNKALQQISNNSRQNKTIQERKSVESQKQGKNRPISAVYGSQNKKQNYAPYSGERYKKQAEIAPLKYYYKRNPIFRNQHSYTKVGISQRTIDAVPSNRVLLDQKNIICRSNLNNRSAGNSIDYKNNPSNSKINGNGKKLISEKVECAPYILNSVNQLPRIRDILHRTKMQRLGVKRYY